MTTTPNIFDYATSELSQDAFICYLLEFGKSEFNGTREYSAAHNFLEKCGIVGEDVKEIKRQYKIKDNTIDVLVITDTYLLIIEDKTYSNEHSDQIVRYVGALRNIEKYKDKMIKVCYFKTGDYFKGYIPPSDQDILSPKDCTSLGRSDILEILRDIRQDNLIFDSFCVYWETPDKDIDDEDISTWTRSKWFLYLKKLFNDNGIKAEDKCDINSYVPNASGGFYATHFDWKNLPDYMQLHYKQGRAGIYNQIELFFSDNRTSRINLAYRFHSDNWNKEETKEYRKQGILSKLQERIKEEGYKNQNKMGASTAYKVISFGDNKRANKPINKNTTKEILLKIEKFISNQL